MNGVAEKLSSPMTVLQVIPHLDTGGAELACVEIAEALVANGHRALVAGRPGRLTAALKAVGGAFLPFDGMTKSPISMWRNAGVLEKMIGDNHADLIHARSRAPAWSARLASRRTGIPFVTTYHGIYSERSSAKRFYNSVMASGNMVIANSGFTADLVRQRYGTPEARLRTINRGFDERRFDPAAIDVDAIASQRQAWGVAQDEIAIVLAGRLTSWKGQSVLLQAAAQLMSADLPPFKIILVGDDQGRKSYREELETLVSELRLGAQIHFAGPSLQMAVVFAAADIAVSASTKPEAFGRIIVESQAMTCPVIVSDLGPVHETVLAQPDVPAGQQTGWIVPPNDPVALASAITLALKMQPEDRIAMGKRARAHVSKRFTTTQMAASTLAIYRELVLKEASSVAFS